MSFSKKFAQNLTDDVTLLFPRKGKEAITIGQEAKSKLSGLLTKRDDANPKTYGCSMSVPSFVDIFLGILDYF
jgi:hypothetical protein